MGFLQNPNLLRSDNAVFIDNITLPKTSGKGIKVDTTYPTFGWRDMIGDVSPKTTAVGAATLAVLLGGIYRAWFYAAGSLCDMVFHMPHDYAPGTDLYGHLHWTHNGTAISGSLVVNFGVSYAKGYSQASFPVEIAPVLTVNTPDITTFPQYQHRIDEIQLSSSTPTATQINSSLLEVDGLIIVGLKVATIPTISGGTQTLPAFLTLDLHYQSTNIGTKQKNLNFYI